eukprot:TRINITY_DN8993_c0_g1_i1.p1 TRINITY_DN8993_c0_g1~~TRINITY_DN8993_c0_g1_i1.p1  ORF type:complete len:348 (-),score=88.16 TRINITY_DN8993_c0_g1_i1:12-1055(-)
MALWVLVLGVVVAVGLVISSAVSFWVALRHEDSLDELGVKTTYERPALPEEKIEAYRELKDKLREQFAKMVRDDSWVCQLPAQAKDMLKYRLMQRAIGDMSLLQKIDTDARGYWKLFTKGIITSKFWNSVLAAERELSQEIESVKAEALAIEPTHDPQGIISEAMQFVVRYGDKLPSPPDLSAAAAAAAGAGPGGINAMAAAAQALSAAAAAGGPLPPGCPPLPGLGSGCGLGGGMPPLGLPPGAGPPGTALPQKGGETEEYSWRQDTDEVEVSVHLPDTAVKSEIKVHFQPKALKVHHCGKCLVEGQLASPCVPEGCTWTLSKGHVVVTLEKANPRPWPALFAAKS